MISITDEFKYNECYLSESVAYFIADFCICRHAHMQIRSKNKRRERCYEIMRKLIDDYGA